MAPPSSTGCRSRSRGVVRERDGEWRTIIGNTYPSEADPGTIRGDFAHQSKASADLSGKAIMNLVHASGNADEAKYEIALWFGEDEQFTYETLAEKLAY